MSILNKFSPVLVTACVLRAAAAQSATVSYSSPYQVSRGDSDAGATVYGSTYLRAKKLHTTYGTAKFYHGEGQAAVSTRLDARFLGSSRTVARFSGSLRGTGSYLVRSTGGWPTVSCTQAGSVYLRLGGSTLWNTASSTSSTPASR